MILPVGLYECEAWSLTLSEEHGLGLFEKLVLERKFRPNRDGLLGGCRKLHKEELHNWYSSIITRIIKSRKIRWGGHVARMGENTNVYRLLVGKAERKRILGRPRRR
jgi:hypothetical protein